MVRKALWSTALAVGVALIGAINGLASVAVSPVSSEPSPLATCDNGSQIGHNYVSGEEEPQLAVFGKQMIGMWHQDRWSNGGAHGIGVGTSTDGGTSWTQTVLPDDKCSAAAGFTTDPSLSFYERSSDPWVSFGPDGVAYASALSFDGSDNKNAVAAGSSTDGGKTWPNFKAIPGSIFTSIDQSTDKNATTADPVHAGTAYTVWDTLISPTAHNPDNNFHTFAYSGPAYFSKTVDGGVTWSAAQVIVDSNERQQTIGNIIVVDPRNDNLYDFTDLLVSPNTSLGQGTNGNSLVAFVKSVDHGATWTQPQVIAPFDSVGVVDPLNPNLFLRVGNGLEEVAIDPSNGKLFVVWETSSEFDKNTKQSTGTWDDEIVMATSSNGGATWTGPTVIHGSPGGLPTFTPTVAVNNGVVAVTYFDNRNLGTNAKVMPTDYFVSFFNEDGTSAGAEQRITATSFDQLSAPFARGFFLGDYEGLQPSGSTGFEALFVKTNCDSPYTGPDCGPANFTGNPAPTSNTNPTDVFAAFVAPS